jgi:hypothetical protein
MNHTFVRQRPANVYTIGAPILLESNENLTMIFPDRQPDSYTKLLLIARRLLTIRTYPKIGTLLNFRIDTKSTSPCPWRAGWGKIVPKFANNMKLTYTPPLSATRFIKAIMIESI